MYKLFSSVLILISGLNIILLAQENNSGEYLKIEANPNAGFYWSYLLLIPDTLIVQKENLKIFIVPNNTGRNNDTIAVHERAAIQTIERVKPILKQLNAVALVPVFPRSSKEWRIYTHALDRDVMITEKDSIKRLDLQLVAMIEDARNKLKEKNLFVQDKILMLGFSASGMFVNRFTFLHPELVQAAVIGSPGGMPLVPVKNYKGVDLNYPVGINDFDEIAGYNFNEKDLRKVNLFFFLGDEDENDSVPFDDSYDEAERNAVLTCFGSNIQERWQLCKEIFEVENYNNVQFKLYPGVGHNITDPIISEIISFLIN